MSFIVQKNISLADKNWFKTGGAAKFFCEPQNTLEFIEALNFCYSKKLQLFVLGSGANILINDAGFDGLVIKPKLNTIEISELNSDYYLLSADSGVTIDELINFCFANNLIGLEEFSGIPGTVGGALYINLHYFKFLISDFLFEAKVIDKISLKVEVVAPSWFEFGYNQSKLQQKEHFLISATFKLKKATDLEVAFSKGRYNEIIRHRASRYPISNTCGSFFRNFTVEEVQNTATKLIFVAYYLEQVGVKGLLQFGGAKVSHKHANMIETKFGATSADVINLAREMQRLVFEKFKIMPQPECQLIGFSEYPLFV